MNLILDGRMINLNGLNMVDNSKSSSLHLENASSTLLVVPTFVYNIKIMAISLDNQFSDLEWSLFVQAMPQLLNG